MADDLLEFWYDLASAYSYLAAERVEAVAASRGLRVDWKPFLLGPIFLEQLGIRDSPFNHNPVRGRYMWRDLERSCAETGLPFRKPSVFPRGSVLGARLALIGADEGWAGPFTKAVFRAGFGEDQDVADAQVLAAILDGLGLPGRALCERAVGPEERPRLRLQTETAAALGLFGAPSFRRKGEMFFGNERLEQAADWGREEARGRVLEKVTLADKLALIREHWRPKVVGALNGQEVKLVKLQGEFVWHHHEREDELFLVIRGQLRIDFRDRSVELLPGEFLVVPRGVEHRPVADAEAEVLLFEPAATLNTGNLVDAKYTAPSGVKI